MAARRPMQRIERVVKSDPRFIALREEILELIHSSRPEPEIESSAA